jgi:hypothetical protein
MKHNTHIYIAMKSIQCMYDALANLRYRTALGDQDFHLAKLLDDLFCRVFLLAHCGLLAMKMYSKTNIDTGSVLRGQIIYRLIFS